MKKTIYLIIFFLLLIIIVNKVSKQFLDQTKFEKFGQFENLRKVYGEKFEDYIEVYKYQSFAMIYEPLTEFKEKPKVSKFVSVSQLGNRCNIINLQICEPAKGGDEEIWIFGGSTVFGYGLKNDETIPAYLDKLMNKKKIINFGQGYYNSNQSRIYFQNLLTHLPKPYAVVFFEGFNDFKNNQINNYKYSKTALSNDYEILFNNRNISTNQKIISWFKERFERLNFVRLIRQNLTNKKTKLKSNLVTIDNLDDAYIKLINKLKINYKINKSIGKEFQIKILNVLEPVALSKESFLSSNLPNSYLENFEINIIHLKKIYKLIEQQNDLLNLVDLNLVNFSIDGKMFVDTNHYSAELSEQIALKVYEKLKNN